VSAGFRPGYVIAFALLALDHGGGCGRGVRLKSVVRSRFLVGVGILHPQSSSLSYDRGARILSLKRYCTGLFRVSIRMRSRRIRLFFTWITSENQLAWCGGWDSNSRRPTPQDFFCEPDLKSSPVRSRERSCPFDLNPATIGRGPVHGLGNPRIQHALLFDALNDHSHRRAI